MITTSYGHPTRALPQTGDIVWDISHGASSSSTARRLPQARFPALVVLCGYARLHLRVCSLVESPWRKDRQDQMAPRRLADQRHRAEYRWREQSRRSVELPHRRNTVGDRLCQIGLRTTNARALGSGLL